MFEFSVLKIGSALGIGGFAVAIYYLIDKTIIKKLIFPKFTRKQAFIITLFTKLLVFLLAICSIFAWLGVESIREKKRQHEEVPRSFRIAGINDNVVLQRIADSTGLKYDNSENATFSIRLGYSGSLRPAFNKKYFLYDGGCIVVIVNGEKKCTINELTLSAWSDEPGNPKYLIEKGISKEISEKVIANQNFVINSIITCIRYENQIN